MASSSPLLEYETQIFLDAYHEDGLTILAKGLGIERIFQNFIKLYLDPENLVVVLNTTQKDNEYFIQKMKDDHEVFLPKIINSETLNTVRSNVYKQGGVLFVTTRIFIVDMLNDVIPKGSINGLLIYDAHKIVNSCQDAFALKLFKDSHANGFVKAFSDSPNSFNRGVSSLDMVMKNLYAKHLHLWPRFHATIIDFFDNHKPDIVEIEIFPTTLIKDIQNILFELIQMCVKELKVCCSNVSFLTEDLNLENIVSKNFLDLLHVKLEPYWDQLSQKAQNYVLSIKTLRRLLITLYAGDSSEFLAHLSQICNDCLGGISSGMVSNVINSKHNLSWILETPGETLFVKAQKRKKLGEKKLAEDNPKFLALKKVLAKITMNHVEAEKKEEVGCNLDQHDAILTAKTNPSILILTQNELTAEKLKHLLNQKSDSDSSHGGLELGQKEETADEQLLQDTKGEKDLIKMPTSKKARLVEEGNNCMVLLAIKDIGNSCNNLKVLPINSNDLSTISTLETYKPTHVIMYDPDLKLIRKIELYQALIWSSPPHERPPLHVYFMMYGDSVQEQMYLSSLRNEKEGFEYLIHQKGTLVLPTDSPDHLLNLGENEEGVLSGPAAVPASSTRKAGGQSALLHTAQQSIILVDVREFKSDLPAHLYDVSYDYEAVGDVDLFSVPGKHVKIVPTTLLIGDYILTPQICVERKSINDLVQSLNSGRLYEQAKSMVRAYDKPMLLIEFNSNVRPFLLQSRAVTRSLASKSSKSLVNTHLNQEISALDIQSKLVLLTITFPKLRILWCCTPKMAAEIFLEFKIGKPEPPMTTHILNNPTLPIEGHDEEKAYATTSSSSNKDEDNKKNQQHVQFEHLAHDMLIKMPGISLKNVGLLTRKCANFMELADLSESTISEHLQSKVNGRKLWNFLHNVE